jgi:nitroreductase
MDMDSKSKILNVIQNRRSVRKFNSRPVERDTILTCIEAARLAPSADNVQPWRFIVLDDPEIKRDFEEKVFSGIYRITKWAMKAPVLIILCADLNFVVHQVAEALQTIPYYLLDMGIAGEHFVLQAQELGLGTCWIGWFNVRKAKKILNLPRNVRICELMAVGYPSKDWSPKPKKRKAIEEIVFFNGWGKKT